MEGAAGLKRPSPITLLFATIVVSIMGNGLVFPLIPFFALKFGGDAFSAGLIIASFPLTQFLFAPIWGRISDRFGRKPVLLASLGGASIFFIILATAPSLAVVIFARLLQGAFGGSLGTAQAYVADLYSDEDRARGLGLLGAAFGFGFVFGPSVGGLLAVFGLSAPAFFAAGLAAINFGLAFTFLPESRRRRIAGDPPRRSSRLMVGRWDVILPIVMYGVMYLASGGYQGYAGLFAKDRLGFGPTETGLLFGASGLVSVVMQGAALGPLVRRFGERFVVLLGLVMLAITAVFVPFSVLIGPVGLFLAIAGLTVGESIAAPALTTIISRATRDDEQGAVLGIAQSASSLARVMSPVFGGFIYTGIGPEALFLGCAGVYLVDLVLGSRLPRRKVLVKT